MKISSRFTKLKNIVSKFSPDLQLKRKNFHVGLDFQNGKKWSLPVGEKGGCGGGGTNLQILGFQMGVEDVQKTL